MHNINKAGRDSRSWDKGFMATHCDQVAHPDIDYYEFYKPIVNSAKDRCDFVMNETVVVYGHDNIRNLGHSISDFMNVWVMLWLSGMAKHAKDITFLNMDAIRMGHNYHDEMGGLAHHYELEFARVLKANDFATTVKGGTLCMKRLIFMPRPLVLFTWDGWWQDMPCTFIGPSSLYQRWNLQVRSLYNLLEAPQPQSSSDKTRILLINRRTTRIMSNIDTAKAELEKLQDVVVTVKDMAGMSLEQQMSVMNSADIMIGIHGAGISHR